MNLKMDKICFASHDEGWKGLSSISLAYVLMGLFKLLKCAYEADAMEGEEYFARRRKCYNIAMEFRNKKSALEALMNYRDDLGRSVLNAAIFNGAVFLTDLLLDFLGVDPTLVVSDPVGRTTLHYVCEVGNLALFERILFKRRNLEFNPPDEAGLIPLHLAVLYGHAETAETMLDRGGAVENHDMFFGRTIHAAAFMDQISVVQKICENFREEVSIVISGFCSPHVCALYGGSMRCFAFLWMLSPEMPDKIFSKAVSYSKSEDEALQRVLFLLDKNVDPNAYDEDLCEEPAVLFAAKNKWLQVVNALIQRTSAIPNIEWSTEGVIAYVETDMFKQRDEQRARNKIERLKEKMILELKTNNVLVAMIICDSMKSELDDITYQRFHALCKFYWEMARSSSMPVDVDAEKLRLSALVLRHRRCHQLADLAEEGALSLDPDDD